MILSGPGEENNAPIISTNLVQNHIIKPCKALSSGSYRALCLYVAGVSVRRVEDITEALWGTKVSPGTISNLNKKAYENIEQWRSRPLTGEYPYVFVKELIDIISRLSDDELRMVKSEWFSV